MSIGGNPPTAGSITLDNTVENAAWKSSSNATAQAINTIKLNGTTIWTKPDLQIAQGTPSYNTETEKVTISVTRPTLINSWKYKINSGSLSSAQTSNSIAVSRSSFTNNSNNTITVYGYRDGVLKGNSVAKTVYVAQNNTLSGSASWNRNNNTVSLSVTLGSSLTRWTYQVGSGSQVNGSGTTASFSDSSNGAKTVTFRGFVNNTQKNSTTASYTVAVPSISCTATGGDEQITISISRSNHISSDKWQYRIDSGSWQTGAGIGTTSKLVTGVAAGTRSVQVRLQNSGGTVLATSASVSTTVQVAYVPPTAGSSVVPSNSSQAFIGGPGSGSKLIKTNEISLSGIAQYDVQARITIEFFSWFMDDLGTGANWDDYNTKYVNSTTVSRVFNKAKNSNTWVGVGQGVNTNAGGMLPGPWQYRVGGDPDWAPWWDDDDSTPARGDAGWGGSHTMLTSGSTHTALKGKALGHTTNTSVASANECQLYYGVWNDDDSTTEAPYGVTFVKENNDKLSIYAGQLDSTYGIYNDGPYRQSGAKSHPRSAWANAGYWGGSGSQMKFPLKDWKVTAQIVSV